MNEATEPGELTEAAARAARDYDREASVEDSVVCRSPTAGV